MQHPQRTGAARRVASAEARHRTPRQVHRSKAVLATASLTGLAASTLVAGGIAQAANPPAAGNIEILTARDMVMLDGYTEFAGREATVTVKRGDETIGIATGTLNADGFMEINHDAAQCWSLITPDIRGGDLVEATFDGSDLVEGAITGSAVVTEVTKSEVTPTPEPGDVEATVTISGTYDPADPTIDPERFLVEVVNPDMRGRENQPTTIGERAIAWGPGANVEQPPPGSYTIDGTFGNGEFSATFGLTSEFDQDLVMAGEHIAMSWQAEPTNGLEAQLGLTAWENGNTGGGAPGCPAGPGAQPPKMPTEASITTTEGTDTVEVSWTTPAQGADANQITQWRVAAHDTTVPGRQEVSVEVGGATTTATIVGLTTGQAYPIELEGFNGQWSAPVSVGTATPGEAAGGTPPPPPPPDQTAAPEAPTGVTATATGTGTVELSWTASANATSYEVTTSSARPGAAIPAPVTATGTTASITGLTSGTPYSFAVTAINDAGESPAATATATTLEVVAPAATTITRLAPAHESIAVEWRAAEPGNAASPVTGYDLVAKVGGTTVKTVEVGTVTSGAITGLTNGTAYAVEVYAKSGSKRGPVSTLGQGITSSTVTPNDQVTVSRAEYKQRRNEYKISGSAQDTTANGVTARTTAGATIGSATVAADGSWVIDIRNGPSLPADNQVVVTSTSGGRVTAPITRSR